MGCSGRLLHHLQEIDTLSLQAVEYAVFDEADRLFEMGFADQVTGYHLMTLTTVFGDFDHRVW